MTSRPITYFGEMINFGGEWMPRGEVIAAMQREGQDPRCIDRWLQGYDLGQRLEERRRAIETLAS